MYHWLSGPEHLALEVTSQGEATILLLGFELC